MPFVNSSVFEVFEDMSIGRDHEERSKKYRRLIVGLEKIPLIGWTSQDTKDRDDIIEYLSNYGIPARICFYHFAEEMGFNFTGIWGHRELVKKFDEVYVGYKGDQIGEKLVGVMMEDHKDGSGDKKT